jgi:hypothetical protein
MSDTIIYKDESYVIQGAIFDVYLNNIKLGMLVNFSWPLCFSWLKMK